MTAVAHQHYKSSLEPWVRKIPAHWEEGRAKYLFRQRRERARPEDPQLAATQAYGVIPQEDFMEREGQKVVLALAGTSGFSRVYVDDFVISLRSFQGGIEHSAYSGCVTPAYTVLKPTESLSVPYYRWLLKSAGFISALNATTEGIREGKTVPYGSFGQLILPVPPLEEQCRIAAFLDHETARIDELVREQERLHSLLAEHRSATILQAVTKGLEQSHDYSPSGEYWIGGVPDTWTVAKLGLRYEIQLGKMLDAKQNVGGDQYPYLRNQDVQWESINTHDLPTFRLEPTELARYQVSMGDILVCEGGDVGRSAMWIKRDGVYAYQKALHRVRPKNPNRDDSRYLLYALRAAKEAGAYEQNDQRATISHLTAEAFRDYKFPFPPLEEQRRIVAHLDREVTHVDALARTSRQAIELLLERRSALISAAVTGQLDLRNWQRPEREAVAEVA